VGKNVKLVLNGTTGDLLNKKTTIRYVIASTTVSKVEALVIGDRQKDLDTIVPWHNILFIELLPDETEQGS
jgi:hypothetical protein